MPRRIPEAWLWVGLLFFLGPLSAWLGRRAFSLHPEEPIEWLVALLALVYASVQAPRRRSPDDRLLILAGGLLGASWGLRHSLPGMGLAWLWMLAALALHLRWERDLGGIWGRLGLSILALRVLPVVQVYLGIPLRVGATRLAAGALRISGIDPIVEGASLFLEGQELRIDLPCAGLHSLWIGAFLASFVAARARMRLGPSLALGLGILPWVFALNGIRIWSFGLLVAAGKAPGETGHELLGLGLLGLGLWPWLALARRCPAPEPEPDSEDEAEPARGPWWGLRVLFLGISLLGLLPAPGVRSSSPDFPGWPSTLWGLPLQGIEEVSEGDPRVPGVLKSFVAGPHLVQFLWVPEVTWKLHPRLGCAQAQGFEVQPLGVWRDPEGTPWASSRVVRDGASIWLREQLRGPTGSPRAFSYLDYLGSVFESGPRDRWIVVVQTELGPEGGVEGGAGALPGSGD